MVTTLTAALLAASLPGRYDCMIERQVVITESGSESSQVQFPETERDAWRFQVRIPNGSSPRVTIDWPANPIQVAGTHPTIPLAPGQLALAATGAGPCMFTEQACVTIVELSARDDGSAAFSILPAGSSRDEQSSVRSLFHVVFLGTCRRSAAQ